MKIAGIPKEFKIFFNRFRDLFSKRQFFYFSLYVYGLIVMPKEKKTVAQLSKAWISPLCRSSLEKFLCEVRWEFGKVLQRARTQVLRRLSRLPKKKRTLELVLDDTDLDKFGTSVFGVGWFRHNQEQLPWKAIQMVVLGVLVDEWFVPLDFRLYVQENICKTVPMRFETKNVMAAQMIRQLKLPRVSHVDLMFDSWYLNPIVTQAAEDRGWFWFSRCRCNRKVRWEELVKGEKNELRLEQYAPTIKWQKLEYLTKRKNRALVGHQRIGILNKLGRVKLVCTSLKTSGDGRVAFFCTNHTKVPMVELVKKFERRWKIEVYFRESRAYLALEHWYFRDIASVVHHLCLSLVAMTTCLCLRLDQVKSGECLGTLGEFVRNVQSRNQRAIVRCFFEQWHLEKMTPEENYKFNDLCRSLGF